MPVAGGLKLENQKAHIKPYGAIIKSKYFELSIALLAAFIVTYLTARNVFSQTLVFGDTPWVNPKSPEILWQYATNIWTPAAYGDNTPKPQSYIMLYIFAKIASTLQNMTIYNFLLHMSLPISFLTFYHYSKKFCNTVLARILGATIYLINPVTISYFAAGQLMWILAFLPLSINYYIELLEEKTLIKTLKAALFTSLTIWTLPPITFTLTLGLLTTTLSFTAIAKNKTEYLKTLSKQLLIYGLLVTLCLIPYLYSTTIYINSPLFTPNSNILADFQYTYQEATTPNLLRLAGNEGSPQSRLGYNTNNLSNEIGYIIPTLAFASILWVKNSDKKGRITATLTLLCFTLFFAAFIRFASCSELGWIITDIMVFWTLRNPFKIQLLMLTAIIPPFIFSAEKLIISLKEFLKNKDFKKAAAPTALILIALSHIYMYNHFVFNGYMGIDKYPGINQVMADETLINIVNDSLKLSENKGFRGIILPFDHKTELYVEYSNMFLYPSRLGQNHDASNILNIALTIGQNIENFLRLLSIKHVYINNRWEDTGFHIIQPESPQAALKLLNNANNIECQNGYCKVTLENALPTIYISQYPILYSNIETISLLDPSTFQKNPVFIEVENLGWKTITEGQNASKTFHYALDIPYPETYNLYVIAYLEKPETTITYKLGNYETKEKTLKEEQNPIKDVTQLQLQTGKQNLSITVDGLFMFKDLNHSFNDWGNGTYKIEKQEIKIENGTLISLDNFENFDLTLKFKALNYGAETWHGPYIYLELTNDYYYRIFFHKNGYIELSKYIQGKHQPFLTFKKTNINFKEWNNISLTKTHDTITLKLNNQQVFFNKDPQLNAKVKIGLGSYNSTTTFNEATITKNVIKGIWLIPKENQQTPTTKIIERKPRGYTLQINNSKNTWLTLFLGENYDTQWEATINRATAQKHIKANVYGNLWIFNTPQGIHNIKIHYEPNAVCNILITLSLMVKTALIIIAYIPSNSLQKVFLRYRRKTKLSKAKEHEKL